MCDDNECAPIKPSPITPEPLPNPDKKDAIVVNELPEKGEPNAVYWLLKEGSDAYDLYQWVSDDWRKIDIDISLYGNTGNNTDGAMTQKATTQALGGKQDTLIAGDNIHIAADGKTISADGMVVLSYGNSTWNDFITAYNANRVVYCRASSGANPAVGNQNRMAFMAYVSAPTNPANVEFQYYRSVNTHTESQQGDQVFVYKLTNTNGGTWTAEVREASTKIVAGDNITGTYSDGTLRLDATGGGGSSKIPLYWDGEMLYSDAEKTNVVSIVDVIKGFAQDTVTIIDNAGSPVLYYRVVGGQMPAGDITLSFITQNRGSIRFNALDYSGYNEPISIQQVTDETDYFLDIGS